MNPIAALFRSGEAISHRCQTWLLGYKWAWWVFKARAEGTGSGMGRSESRRVVGCWQKLFGVLTWLPEQREHLYGTGQNN